MTVPQLPPELIGDIINYAVDHPSFHISSNNKNPQYHLKDSPTLTFSLVARSWVAPARRIVWPNGFYAPRTEERFERFKELCTSPHSTFLLTGIRKLYIHSDDSYRSPGLRQFIEWCGEDIPFPSQDELVKPAQFLFGDVETIDVYKIPFAAKEFDAGQSTFSLLAQDILWHQFPKVKTLQILRSYFRTAEVFGILIQSPLFRNLDVFIAREIRCFAPVDDGLRKEAPTPATSTERVGPLPLRTLSIACLSAEMLTLLPPLPNLRTLECEVFAGTENTVVFLEALNSHFRASPALEVLKLNISFPRPPLGWHGLEPEHEPIRSGLLAMQNWPHLRELQLDVEASFVIPLLTLEKPHRLSTISIEEVFRREIDLSSIDRAVRKSFPLLETLSFHQMPVKVTAEEARDSSQWDTSTGTRRRVASKGSLVWEKSERVREGIAIQMPWCAEKGCLKPSFEYYHIWSL
ncbi:hypothetical protein VNI00_005990 [Paramarasmius palmivorus]|uniref:F-box domain-containing protein n=1 Tax=Paramarasmius palmivorus TaxID=297713 RepID=A0AAW0DF44_9AGAR